ncbi:MAG: phosphoribosylformylglycinamidine cyclo-ligase [Aquificota bacterium]|nr:phosphoribosylformylglycinamidine cyclo-ligase [Aquificota bacterium]
MTTYRDSGVDIERAENLTRYIKEKVEKAFPGRLTTGFGGFASGMDLTGYRNPVLFSSADGVGTKLKIAHEIGIHDTVGVDLVAMNVNDVVTTGAKPIFFLDYIATGRIDLKVLKSVVDGIVKGCEEAGVVLAGGETAEMPGFYPEGVYDLAGFCVGVCERDEIIDGSRIKPGDTLIGLRSSGFHSNGYSLIRKVLRDRGVKLTDRVPFGDLTVGEVLLKPTRIYVKQVLSIRTHIKGVAHITGGGIPGNLVRILPEGVRAVVEKASLPEDPVFEWIADLGNIPEAEMFRTFNMGVGMILVVGEEERDRVLEILKGDAFVCGYTERGERGVSVV